MEETYTETDIETEERKIRENPPVTPVTPVNSNSPTLTLTLSNGLSIGLSTIDGGWIGHIEGQPTNQVYTGYVTVTPTPWDQQLLQSLVGKQAITGTSTLTIVVGATTVCTLSFQSVSVSLSPPYSPGHPVPNQGVPGQYTIIG